MKAVVMKGPGEPRDVLAIHEVDNLPPPSAGEVIVRMQKRAVHPADYQTIRGFLPTEVFAPGGIPGIDGVGRVEAIGPGVDTSGVYVGARVIVYHAHRTWADRVAVPATMLMPVPDDIDDAVACQLATNGITAVMLLRAAEQAIEGATGAAPLVITAAASGVARTIVALSISKGHRAIGLVRREADAAALTEQLAGVPVIGTGREDWHAAVLAAAGGPVAVAIDPIGGEMMPALLGLLGPGGTLITYGQLDPRSSSISSGFVTSFEFTIRGCSAMGWAMRTPPEGRAADFTTLFELVRRMPQLFAGYQEFALGDVVQAIAAAEASPRRGATILAS